MVVTLKVSKLSGWLNADFLNMDSMVATLDVSKLSGWLNAAAFRNMKLMSTTLDVLKLSDWLNAVRSNMLSMSVTLEVSQLSGWLNTDAVKNKACILVTLEVSQPDKSALKLALHGAFLMRERMSVTADTSQAPIVPCVASAAAWSAQNSRTPVVSSALVANTVADPAWAIASTPSRRQWPRAKTMLPIERDSDPRLVERDDRACVNGSRGFCVPLASVCPAAAVDIGRSLAAAAVGLGTGWASLVWRAISGRLGSHSVEEATACTMQSDER